MRIPGVKTAKILSRWAQARIFGGALILGYHRVANETTNVYDVCVSTRHFFEQMEMVSKFTRPIHLSTLVQHLKNNSLPPKTVAVTFDDGYADNLYNAKPVLEKYDVPATIFVCTGYFGKEFWWDELERLITSSDAELGELNLKVGENQFVWNQPKVKSEANGKLVRREFRHRLYRFLLQMDVEDQRHAMDLIRNWSGVPSDAFHSSRGMTQDELLQIAESEAIEIGSHTRHHLMLPRLSVERQKDEIITSKKDLEDLLGKHISGFSYPNGKASVDVKRFVREAGAEFACTSFHDVVRPNSDLFELPRFWQKDVSGDKFMQGLRSWMKPF